MGIAAALCSIASIAGLAGQNSALTGNVLGIAGVIYGLASVAHVVRRARVVLSTAGPFVRDSWPVVDACVALGADYVDVRQLLDAGYHKLAAAKLRLRQRTLRPRVPPRR